jgi:7-cyano-7-deazaguanine synthase
MTALVVLSGGMDSVTALALAAQTHGTVHALTANYGQRHVREVDAARWQADRYADRHDIVDLTTVGALLAGSALTDDTPVPEGHYSDASMSATVVPNRNAILANVAAGVAVARKLDAIVLGVHAGDHPIYPDCRPEFINALQVMLNVANDGYHRVQVEAPFLNVDKHGILRIGHALGVDYSHTWTCYKGADKACGRCGSCVERLEAFAEIGATDPVEYQ